MPIYMDRHDVSETVTAEHVAKLHQEDIKVEHKYNCQGLTYWFDERRKMAFCLIEAPDMEAIEQMHDEAHGDVPHRIIEVDPSVVESFLGRIEDPKKVRDSELNIINDSAFRAIMVIGLNQISIPGGYPQSKAPVERLLQSIGNVIDKFDGSIVEHNTEFHLVSFESVSKAVLAAIEIRSKFYDLVKKHKFNPEFLKVGLNTGVPVTADHKIYEETIKLAKRMCSIIHSDIVVSSEVRDIYKQENFNVFINSDYVKALKPAEEKFINEFMDFVEVSWQDPSLKITDFSKKLGVSQPQMYRITRSLTGKSPNNFMKDYRLNQALLLLNKRNNNISEIAFETGFNSPAYFSKCFYDHFGLRPSDYVKISLS